MNDKAKQYTVDYVDHNFAIILDNSPMPKGRNARVVNQIARINMTLKDGAATAELFASAPEMKEERDDLKKALAELVKTGRKYIDAIRSMKFEGGEITIGEALVVVDARECLEVDLAAAENLLNGVDDVTDEPSADAGS